MKRAKSLLSLLLIAVLLTGCMAAPAKLEGPDDAPVHAAQIHKARQKAQHVYAVIRRGMYGDYLVAGKAGYPLHICKVLALVQAGNP